MIEFIEKYTSVTELEKSVVVAANSLKKTAKDEVFKAAGEENNESYFVLSGVVYLSLVVEDDVVISDFFFAGEPVILPEPAICYQLTSLVNSELAVTQTDQIESLIEQVPSFENVCRLFAEESMAKKSHFTNSIKKMSPLEKYIFLFQEREKVFHEVPQKLIANFLGVTPETLSRVRRQVAQKNIDLHVKVQPQ